MTTCRKHWKRILLIFAVAVLLPYGADQVLMKTLVKGDKIAVESLTIPLQQMAAVVARGGEMNEYEAAVMDTIMPYDEMSEFYLPSSSDGLKWGTGGQYLNKTWIVDNIDVFLSTWASMLGKNLNIYVEAYLLEHCHIGVLVSPVRYKVLRTILRLFGTYHPLAFFGLISFILLVLLVFYTKL